MRSCAWSELTALHGEDGEVVDRVGLSVQRLGRADDPTHSVHVEEALQVGVPVDGVPGQKKQKKTHTTDIKNCFKIEVLI